MKDVYLFESGSTKTDLMYEVDGEKHELKLPGFNPNRKNGAFEIAIEEGVDIREGSSVYFYGSGLGSKENKDFVKNLFSNKSIQRIQVFDDILGAGRAAFGQSEGIICILGTGGLAAYYNGRDIVKRRGGYGYLIDDLGGGFELGQRIISAWLNGDFSDRTEEYIESHIEFTKDQIIHEIYSNNRLDLIAKVPLILAEAVDEKLTSILNEYLKAFVRQNVAPLAKEFALDHFSVVGSVGTAFYRELRVMASIENFHLDQCIQSPVQRLFDFHTINP